MVTEEIIKLYELGVGNSLEAEYLFENKIINELEFEIAFNMRMPGSSLGHTSDMSLNPHPPLLYPKWCYENLNFGINKNKK